MRKINKIIGIIAIICVFMTSFTGCGKEEAESKFSATQLMEKVLSGINDLPEVEVVTEKSDDAESIFSYLSDLNFDKVKSFEYRFSKEGLADEIAVIEVKNSDDVDSVMKDLNDRVETRKNTFKTYDEKEVSKFDTALVVAKDNYILMIIGNQSQNGKYEFNKAFE